MRYLQIEALESRTLLAIDAAAVVQDSVTLPRAPAEDPCTFAYPGDANCDRVFDSSDLVLVMQSAKYEDGFKGNSNWREGDFDGDGDFTSSDLVMAFQNGNYDQGGLVGDDSACGPPYTVQLPLFGGLLVYLRGRTDADDYRVGDSESDLETLARCRSSTETERWGA